MGTAEDDARLGELFRLLRIRQGLTQEELSLATAIPTKDIRRLEAGAAGDLRLARTRRLLAEVQARARLNVWWNGAGADRLLDERHAALSEIGAAAIGACAWATPAEVTFSEFGERGSIDIFAHRQDALAVAVCEVKSAFGSLEETNRSLDAKVRLAPTICRDRFGWVPKHVARLLILPDVSSARHVVARHRTLMDQLYPARAREIRRWLRRPDRNLGGIWFVSIPPNTPIVSPRRL